MTEPKKIIMGVLGGITGIAILFAIVLLLVGKGDEPISYPQPILAQQPKPTTPQSAPIPVQPVQPQPLLTERPLTPPPPPLPAQTEARESSASLLHPPATSTRAETKPAPATPASPPVADRAPIGETPSGTTATGIPTYVGPRGGVYHYSKSGNKVYKRRSGGSRRR